MTRTFHRVADALDAAARDLPCNVFMGALAAPAPALAMQILDAADHAELRAEISATQVNRIALGRRPDREGGARAGRLRGRARRPVGRPLSEAVRRTEAAGHDPVTLFVGTEKGFTYRLTLTPSARGSAQILIRNGEGVAGLGNGAGGRASPAGSGGGPHVAALVKLVRAVARREPLPGYAIHAAGAPIRGASARTDLHRDLAGPAFRGARLRGRASGAGRCGWRTAQRASPGPSTGVSGHGPGRRRYGWRRPAPDPAGGQARGGGHRRPQRRESR